MPDMVAKKPAALPPFVNGGVGHDDRVNVVDFLFLMIPSPFPFPFLVGRWEAPPPPAAVVVVAAIDRSENISFKMAGLAVVALADVRAVEEEDVCSILHGAMMKFIFVYLPLFN